MMITLQQATEWQDILAFNLQASSTPDDDNDADLADDDDEAYEDEAEDDNDLHEIRVGDDLGEPDPEEDDHLPDEELQ
jgi:hypothetical protein